MTEVVKAAATQMAPVALTRRPAENTAALLSWLQQRGLTIAMRTKLEFQTDSRGEMIGWRDVVTGADIALAPSANPPAALAAVRQALAPASDQDMRIWLAELSTVTVRRAESVEEGMLTLTAYTKRLAAYPGDVVREVLQDWDGKWFPAWADLKKVLDDRSAPRRAIHARLAALCPNGEQPAGSGAPTATSAHRSLEALRRELIDRLQVGLKFREAVPEGMEERDYIAAEIERIKRAIAELEETGG